VSVAWWWIPLGIYLFLSTCLWILVAVGITLKLKERRHLRAKVAEKTQMTGEVHSLKVYRGEDPRDDSKT